MRKFAASATRCIRPPTAACAGCSGRASPSRDRDGRAETEIYFRIVHIGRASHNGGHVAAYREQEVEIALGLKSAFENGNIGALRRRMLSDKVVSAVLPPRGKPKPPREPRTPRVVELLRKAIERQDLLESGEFTSQNDTSTSGMEVSSKSC